MPLLTPSNKYKPVISPAREKGAVIVFLVSLSSVTAAQLAFSLIGLEDVLCHILATADTCLCALRVPAFNGCSSSKSHPTPFMISPFI